MLAQNSGCTGAPSEAPPLTALAGNNEVHLSWSNINGATQYYVFRTEGVKGCDLGKVKIATETKNFYDDTEALNSRSYYYNVQPVGANTACLGPLSNCAIATPRSQSDAPPGKLGNNIMIAKNGNELTFSWTAPAGTCNATCYNIYKGTLPFSAYDHLPVECCVTGLFHSIPLDSESYYYLIAASNNEKEGSYGNDYSGNEIPQSSSSCQIQDITACN